MSKTVDILLIDGPLSGTVVNHSLPVPTALLFNEHMYTLDTHAQVHVAFYDPEDISADVDAMIAASGLTPSWDLK